MVNFRKKSRNIKSKKTNSQKTNSRKTNSQKTNSQKTIKHGGATVPSDSDKDKQIKLKQEEILQMKHDIEKVCLAKKKRIKQLTTELAEDKLLKEILEKFKEADIRSFNQEENEYKIAFSNDERDEYSELFDQNGGLKGTLFTKIKGDIDEKLSASGKEIETIKADGEDMNLIITMKNKEQTSSSSSAAAAAAPEAAPTGAEQPRAKAREAKQQQQQQLQQQQQQQLPGEYKKGDTVYSLKEYKDRGIVKVKYGEEGKVEGDVYKDGDQIDRVKVFFTNGQRVNARVTKLSKKKPSEKSAQSSTQQPAEAAPILNKEQEAKKTLNEYIVNHIKSAQLYNSGEEPFDTDIQLNGQDEDKIVTLFEGREDLELKKEHLDDINRNNNDFQILKANLNGIILVITLQILNKEKQAAAAASEEESSHDFTPLLNQVNTIENLVKIFDTFDNSENEESENEKYAEIFAQYLIGMVKKNKHPNELTEDALMQYELTPDDIMNINTELNNEKYNEAFKEELKRKLKEAAEEPRNPDNEKLTELLTGKTYQQIIDIFMYIVTLTNNVEETANFSYWFNQNIFITETMDENEKNDTITKKKIKLILVHIVDTRIRIELLKEIQKHPDDFMEVIEQSKKLKAEATEQQQRASAQQMSRKESKPIFNSTREDMLENGSINISSTNKTANSGEINEVRSEKFEAIFKNRKWNAVDKKRKAKILAALKAPPWFKTIQDINYYIGNLEKYNGFAYDMWSTVEKRKTGMIYASLPTFTQLDKWYKKLSREDKNSSQVSGALIAIIQDDETLTDPPNISTVKALAGGTLKNKNDIITYKGKDIWKTNNGKSVDSLYLWDFDQEQMVNINKSTITSGNNKEPTFPNFGKVTGNRGGGKRRRTRWRPRKKKSNKTYRKKPKKIRQKKNKTQRKRKR